MFNELNVKEAAAFLNMKESNFRDICAKGDGPTCRRNGRARYFLQDHLTTWKDDYIAKAYKEPSNTPVNKTAKKTVPGTKKAASESKKAA